MRKLCFLILFFALSGFIEPVWVFTSSVTVDNTYDTGTLINTGGAVTYTLTATTNNYSCTIINNGIGVLTISPAIEVKPGVTMNTLSNSRTEITPNGIGNKIKIHRDSGGIWRAI